MTTTLEFPYSRTLGPVVGEFFIGLRDQRLLACRTMRGRVLFPPLEYDPDSGESVEPDLFEVGSAGTVRSWAWVPAPTSRHPVDRPFAFALIQVDGTDTSLVHILSARTPDEITVGMRVTPRWRTERTGRIDDIESWQAET